MPSFDAQLVKGVATYALELFRAVPDLDAVYAPIGMGSGICGLIAARDLLGLKTEIVGVVAEAAPAVALSFEAGQPVPTNSAAHVRRRHGLPRARTRPQSRSSPRARRASCASSEDEIAEAIRLYWTATHNVAEGAGAAPLAALLKERGRMARQARRPDPERRQHRHRRARDRARGPHARGLAAPGCYFDKSRNIVDVGRGA